MSGQAVEVYDGRKWPVVRCDSIFISSTDSTHKVTQTLLLSPRINEKKRKASKYTVAVGTVHGHVQAFLKYSDLVLEAYLQCPVKEKCLMLIKRPKDAPRKLQKAQSLNNLSMSDSQLYTHHDRTDLNNLHVLHKIKRKISSHSDKEHLSDFYSLQSRLKKSGPPATARYTKKAQAPRPNAFVPIPELGIYTPDQHVLQNGTYAQHCHVREVNNNKKNHLHLDSISSTATSTNGSFSFDSSFEDSVNSFAIKNKSVHAGFDSKREKYHHNDIYHSCLDLPNSQRTDQGFSNLNAQNFHNSHYKTTVNRNMDSDRSSADNNSVQAIKRLEKTDNYRMDANARSHSLGDLSTGLTFSLVGQKKAESVMTMVSDHQMEKENSSGSGTSTETLSKETSSRDIHEKFQNSVVSSQTNLTIRSPPPSKNSEFQKLQDKYTAQISSTRTVSDTCHNQPKHQHHFHESYQHLHQNEQQQPVSHHQRPEVQKRQSVSSGYVQPNQNIQSPRPRKDPEDATSGYRTAVSDVKSSQDLNTGEFNNKSSSAISANISRGNNISYSSSSISAPSREHFPVKPKRSLPYVPLTETSERIKRFTEMMKSRMSVGSSSSSRNGSVDSASSKQMSPRMSSSTGSQIANSRKSSTEATSDNEVFNIVNNNYYQDGADKSQNPGFASITEVSNHLPHSQFKKHDNVHSKKQGHYNTEAAGSFSRSDRGTAHHCDNRKDSHIKYTNRRKSFGDYVFYQENGQRVGHYFSHNGSTNGCVYESLEDDVYPGQCRSMRSSEETPVLPGDRSSDSGQTTGTNHSYSGSALDSGYTTNNDCENDSCKSHSHHHHYNQKQQLYPEQQQHHHHHGQFQQLIHYHENKQRSIKDEQIRFSDQTLNSKPSNKQSSNLANSRHFGSVQNVSSCQAHGNPKNFNIIKNSQHFNSDKYAYTKPGSLGYHSKENSAQSTQDKKANHKNQNGSAQCVYTKTEALPVSRLLNSSPNCDRSAATNIKSWSSANGNKNNGFTDSQKKRTERDDEKYLSSESLLSSRGCPEGTYMHMNYNSESKQLHHLKNQNQSINTSQSFHSNNNHFGHVTRRSDFTPLMSHSFHGDLDKAKSFTQNQYNDHVQMHKSNITHSSCVQPSIQQTGQIDDQRTSELYRKSNDKDSSQDQNEVRPRPVPVSRANRLARGHTLPGGFRFSDSDSNFPNFLCPGQDISLFHMTQKYDFSPLLINLPQNMLLRDVLELEDFSVEFSMVGGPGLPSSPQGKMPQIGTPGSAFTPVRHSVDQNKSLTARLKVACFSHVWDEVHKHTTLGRALEGDIVIEVNGWFCLGADVTYLMRIIENCQGSITFTVARVKENDETRYKGQTAAERIKGLECEISRLDDLIQARDDKIRDLISATGSLSFRQHAGTLSAVNGKIPVEGMVIGGDEYVV